MGLRQGLSEAGPDGQVARQAAAARRYLLPAPSRIARPARTLGSGRSAPGLPGALGGRAALVAPLRPTAVPGFTLPGGTLGPATPVGALRSRREERRVDARRRWIRIGARDGLLGWCGLAVAGATGLVRELNRSGASDERGDRRDRHLRRAGASQLHGSGARHRAPGGAARAGAGVEDLLQQARRGDGRKRRRERRELPGAFGDVAVEPAAGHTATQVSA